MILWNLQTIVRFKTKKRWMKSLIKKSNEPDNSGAKQVSARFGSFMATQKQPPSQRFATIV